MRDLCSAEPDCRLPRGAGDTLPPPPPPPDLLRDRDVERDRDVAAFFVPAIDSSLACSRDIACAASLLAHKHVCERENKQTQELEVYVQYRNNSNRTNM